MKKYAKQTLLALVLLGAMSFQLAAQQFKVGLSKGDKIKIIGVTGSIYVEEHSGSELIINVPDYHIPEKAKGMRIITGGNDNTKVGLFQKKEGKTLVLRGVRRKNHRYYLKVPKGVALMANLRSTESRYLEVKNFTGEIEVDVAYTKVHLENVSGPVLLNATYKGPKVIFSKVNQNKPSSIVCPYGDIDVTLPTGTKANVIASSSYGDIFTNMNLKVEDPDGHSKKSKVRGKLNGGGVEIEIRSPYKNIYIRKK